jgi:hypothetical protein
MRAANELIDRIVRSSRIPSRRRRQEIQRELRCHIEDLSDAAREAGHSQDEIEALLLARFGDPGQISRGFAWVYRQEWRMLRALVYVLSTMLLASALLLAMLATQAGLAFGLGTPISGVLASRHTWIEALDILASTAAYLGLISLEGVFQSNRFSKAAMLLTAIFLTLMMSSNAAGLRVFFLLYGLLNAVSFRALQLLVTPRLVRIGIVIIFFPLAGLVLARLWMPGAQVDVPGVCASWMLMGAGYLMMTNLAARIDTAVLNGLRHI